MKKIDRLFIHLTIILTLTVSGWAFQKAQDLDTPEVKMVSGKVLKIDDKLLSIEAKVKGSEASETITFLLREDTQKPSDLAVGTEVSVQYREQGEMKTAIVITPKSVLIKP